MAYTLNCSTGQERVGYINCLSVGVIWGNDWDDFWEKAGSEQKWRGLGECHYEIGSHLQWKKNVGPRGGLGS